MSNEVDIETIVRECAKKALGDDYDPEGSLPPKELHAIQEICEAYHKAKCEQSEAVRYEYLDDDGNWRVTVKTVFEQIDSQGAKCRALYTTPPDQSAEIERLKAREKVLIKAIENIENIENEWESAGRWPGTSKEIDLMEAAIDYATREVENDNG